MPSLPLAVSVADILEVRGGPLREGEVWALLCQSAAAIQDYFIKGATHKDGSLFAISPLTLNLCQDGQVTFGPGNTTWHGTDIMAPEYSNCCQHSMSDTAVEKMFVYTLGRTLQVATEHGLQPNEYVNISRHLESLLEAMCEENPTVRIGLRPVLEACDLHTRQHPGKPPYAQSVTKLYHSVLGPFDQTGTDSNYGSDRSCQSTLNIRLRRRQAHHRHHHYHHRPNHRSQSPSPTRSCSRSRSRSPSRETSVSASEAHLTGEVKESQHLSPVGTNCASTIVTTSPSLITSTTNRNSHVSQSASTLNSRAPSRTSQDVLNTSFASSGEGHTLLYHTVPAYRSLTSTSGLVGLSMGSPAYKKYLQLKERQHRLKVAQQGGKEDPGGDRLSTLHLMPPTSSMLIDYATDARSMSSLMSYTLGSYMTDLCGHFGTDMTTNMSAEYDHEQASIISSDMSSIVPEDASTCRVSRLNVEETENMPSSPSSLLKRRHDGDTAHQLQTNLQQDQEQQKQHFKQFDSKLHVLSTPEREQLREFYGPEFVHRASEPLVRLSLPLQGESQKHPALARRVIIVHLTGQKFEVFVDPCLTGRQLFDAVVTQTALDDFSFFGLTYLCDGEHFFIDADSKLHKMAPTGWREGAKGHMPPVTFTVFLRVKFYPESLAHFRHTSSEHLLYLQLRRDILEERCMASDQQLLALTGLALQAEFGDYHCNTMGHNYFVPEQYIPARTACRLGMAYVHDRALVAHQETLGLTPSQCEVQFIETVQSLPEYGVHFYKLMKVKNEPSSLAWLGITQSTMILAEPDIFNRTVTEVLPWASVLKISFNKRRFSIQPKVYPTLTSRGKSPKVNFYTNSYRKGRYLLQFSTAQHRFHIHTRTRNLVLDSLLEERQDNSEQPSLPQNNEKNQGELDDEEENADKEAKAGSKLSDKAIAALPISPPEPKEKPGAPPVKYRRPPPYPNLKFVRDGQKLTHPSSVVEDWLATTVDSNMQDVEIPELNKLGFESGTFEDGAISQVAKPDAFQPHINYSSVPAHVTRQLDSHLPSRELPLGRYVFEVTLEKEGDKGIGITIVGGEATSKLDFGIFIKSVLKDGPAARDGQICAGDRLIAINGVSLEGVQHQEAVRLIRDSEHTVTLLISQIRPPKTVRRKGDTSRVHDQVKSTDIVNMEDPKCYSDDDDVYCENPLCNDSPSISHSSDIASISTSPYPGGSFTCSHPYKQAFQLVHQVSVLSENIDSVAEEHFTLDFSAVNQSEGTRKNFSDKETYNDDLESTDVMLLSDELLAAAELDKHSICSDVHSDYSADDSGDWDTDHMLGADAASNGDFQELEILGDIANMTPGNSDTDSDFDSALEVTVKGRALKSLVNRGSIIGQSKSTSLHDLVLYEMMLEKDGGSLGFTHKDGPNTLSDKVGSSVLVESVVPGGAADRGGILQPGDQLLEVNGKEIKGYNSAEVAQVLRAAPAACVLKVARTKSSEAAFLSASQTDLNLQGRPNSADVPLVGPESMTGDRMVAAIKDTHLAPQTVGDLVFPIVSALPPLTVSLEVSDEAQSNNTQSDVDSDVLDSSRSELVKICEASKQYLKDRDYDNDDLDTAFAAAAVCDSQDDDEEISDKGGSNPGDVEEITSSSALESSQQSLLLQTRDNSVEIKNKRIEDSSELELQEFSVELQKPPGGGLGFTVAGSAATGGCYVKAVVLDPALSDGRLRPGDMLIQVNGQDMTGLSHFEAVMFLRQLPQEVSIRAQRYANRALDNLRQTPLQKAKHNGPPSALQIISGAKETEEHHRQQELTTALKLDEKLSESADAHTQSKEAAEQYRSVKELIRCLDMPKTVVQPNDYGDQHKRKDKMSGPVELGKSDNNKESVSQSGESPRDKEQDAAEESKENILIENKAQMIKVMLHKPHGADSLGFSLKQRWHNGQLGFFVNTITSGGVAYVSKQLRVGDRLLQTSG
ncbi:tyrosine-protein phosphatase non-receptor type 13-like isoform X6 [Pomacea canaliculata]|uniref:tyrosine-protein phosphatase non-receptor type 13-like isoform X6 n=1 Tax=Pomacea canaliculata TaxID=400727 RepID=UPI000D72C223|nr:tyrosine-protein phosphatase non-receptor type 13-like isoform X6 [Pomacea canaliculata]